MIYFRTKDKYTRVKAGIKVGERVDLSDIKDGEENGVITDLSRNCTSFSGRSLYNAKEQHVL